MLVRAHGVRRLMDDRLATEELRLSRPHDQHEDQTEQDQPEPQDEHQPDPSDAGAAAVRRVSAVTQSDTQDKEQTQSAEQREQEHEDEVVRAFEETMAEEPDAAEGRQAVVEADHDA